MLVALALLGCAPLSVLGQTKPRRIGFLVGSARNPAIDDVLGGFVQGMRERGWTEGKDFIIEWRYAEGRFDRFPELASDLVRQKVEVIVVSTSAAIPVVMKATDTIPIVMGYASDPVASGFVTSLSRPGGNVTGMSGTSDIHAKQLGLLKTVKPRLTRVAVLTNPRNPTHASSMRVIRDAAKKSKIDVIELKATNAEEIEPALATLKREHADALMSLADAVFFFNQQRIAQVVLSNGLPFMAPQTEYAGSGALLSYGEPLKEFLRRAATPVDRILKGVKPADIPVEQPNLFELVVNLRTAKALGLAIPQSVLVQATRVIQ